MKLDVVGFQEDEHDYHFRVELPEPKCCQSCGTLYNLVKLGKDDQAYRDVPIHDNAAQAIKERPRGAFPLSVVAFNFGPETRSK